MKMISRFAGAAVLVLAGLPAAAQTAGSRTPRATPAATAPAEAPTPAAQVRAGTDRHLAMMQARLKITPAQLPLWEAFSTVSRDNAAEMHQRFEQRRTGLERFDASQNMADFAQISELHARQLARLSASFHALYVTLPVEQQREADVYFRDVRNPESGTARGPRPARRN